MIFVPYHLDERLSGLEADLPAAPGTTVTAELAEGDVWARLAALYDRVADVVAAQETTPIVVSGDCTVSLAAVTGLQRAGEDVGVVWFDAHGDVQTLETTTSGYIGGMPLRLLVGYRRELIAERLGLRAVPEERAVLAGARDLDPAEIEYLATATLVQYNINAIRPPDGKFLVHVDLDVVDPTELPGLMYPVGGGPSADALLTSVRELVATGRVAGLDIACTWRPDGGNAQRRNLIAALTKSL
ncbi:arginase family protein [Dactylosporangium sp. NPDC049140]|jgi:arginase|uniref:arginase family protein n=1 Tax=Dactylosporangium sp. NPDC049140 TaxID=3155647 RepID=UPI0033DA4450